MGKKSKAKTKAKKKVKKIAKAKGKKIPLKKASKLVQQSEQQGLDLGALAESALGGIPFVGGLLQEGVSQVRGGALGGGTPGRGGSRGVQLVDATLGNLGTISRRKALGILINRGKRPPRRSKPTFIQVPQGQSVVRV